MIERVGHPREADTQGPDTQIGVVAIDCQKLLVGRVGPLVLKAKAIDVWVERFYDAKGGCILTGISALTFLISGLRLRKGTNEFQSY